MMKKAIIFQEGGQWKSLGGGTRTKNWKVGGENSKKRTHMYKGLDIEKGLVYSKNRKEASVPEASVSEGENV